MGKSDHGYPLPHTFYRDNLVTYTLGLVALTVPAAIFPKVEILKYLSLNFNYALPADKTIIQNTAIVAVGFILAFTALGLITFEKQDL